MAVAPRRGGELVHFGRGKVPAGPQLRIRRAPRHGARGNCSVFDGWHHQFEVRLTHENQSVVSAICIETAAKCVQ